MPKRPFYVQRNGECVPLEGAWRIEILGGEWYVLGHHSVVPCGSERAALSMLAQLSAETDANRLAADAIADLDVLTEFETSGAFETGERNGRPEDDALPDLEPG